MGNGRRIWAKVLEKVCILLLGGVAYGLVELIWRGYTHWTMVCLGGVCFLVIYGAEKRFRSVSLWIRCVAGGIFITSLELMVGSIVNIALGMRVWDYSELPFNFCGQICLQFLLLWMLLCIPALFLCDKISRYFEGVCM